MQATSATAASRPEERLGTRRLGSGGYTRGNTSHEKIGGGFVGGTTATGAPQWEQGNQRAPGAAGTIAASGVRQFGQRAVAHVPAIARPRNRYLS